MNEVQALNILTSLANKAQENGLFKDINESGTIYTALIVLSQFMPPAPNPEDQEGYHATGNEGTILPPVSKEIVEEYHSHGDPQGDSE